MNAVSSWGRLSQINSQLEALEALEGGLGALADPLVTASKWVAHTAPSGAGELDLFLVTLELAVFLFFPDDSDYRDHVPSRCRQFLRDGDVEHFAPEVPYAAASAMRELFEASPLWTREHIAQRQVVLTALERRNRWKESGDRPSFDEYLEVRKKTIYIERWLEVWLSLCGEECERGAFFRAALDDALCFEIYQNELFSVRRDSGEGTPNLAVLLASERGESLEWAAATLTRRKDACRARLHDTPRGAFFMQILWDMVVKTESFYAAKQLARYEDVSK